MENKICICKNCNENFEVKNKDLDFYKQIQVPIPTHCSDCRMQRRLTYRCERALYKRKCDLCGKDIISIHHEDNIFPVYCRECWWSDKGDPFKYGQQFDFTRPFFQQFAELQNKVPRLNIFTNKSENCDYTCHSFGNKNCYLSFRIKNCEDVYYTLQGISSKDCLDCFTINESELCYECTDCDKCYNCKFLSCAKNCHDCIMGYDLIGCNDCFGCCGLRNKQYYILNNPKSQAEYKDFIKDLNFCDKLSFQELKEKFLNLKLKTPHKYLNSSNNQNCLGDYLYNSKNSYACYDSESLEDCAYSTFIFKDKNCYDLHGVGESELSYESMGVEEVYNVKFCYLTDNTKDSYYCGLCFNSNNLFGCIGLKHNKYCILNKQYTRKEYEDLLPRIIQHMGKQYGEFFPIQISPYGYNETAAYEDYPLTREEALSRGYKWKEKDAQSYKPQTCKVASNIQEVPESIIKEILACNNCEKNFKIIPQELKFYKYHSLPIPSLCPDCRHMERKKQRNPRHLWDRNCQKCGTKIKTTYSPDRPEIVCCEKCYLQAIV